MIDEMNAAPTLNRDLTTLKPEEGKPEVQKPKKRHGLRNFFITLLIIVVVIIIGIGATGLYTIPGVSSVFGFNKPKDLGVKVSDQAFEELQKKITMVVSDERADYKGDMRGIFSGQVTVDTQNTSEEITSWLSKRAGSNMPVTDIQVKMIEGGVEVSGMANQYIHAPVYAKAMISRTGEKSVSISIASAKVGAFSIPQKYIDQAEDWFNDHVNARMAEVPGFSMTQLEYHDGHDIFKGTMPATAKQPTGGWADLFTK